MKKVLTLLIFLIQSFAFAQAPLSFGFAFDNFDKGKIGTVIPGSPADLAGVKLGDILVSLDGTLVSGKKDTEILAMLMPVKSGSLVFERAGVSRSVTIVKVPRDTFGRICVSGDCENGKGRLKLLGYGGHEYEGTFNAGQPSGQMKVYSASGDLLFASALKNYLAEGSGVRYSKLNGKTYPSAKGVFVAGEMMEGIVMDETGRVLAAGKFGVNGNGRYYQKSGYFLITYRGDDAWLYCEDIQIGSDESEILNGDVIIREYSTVNPKNGKILSKAEYKDGKRDGASDEYDYQNNIIHQMRFSKGVAMDLGSASGIIMEIGGNYNLALGVKYADNLYRDGSFINRIISASFIDRNNGNKLIPITGPPATFSEVLSKFDALKSKNAVAETPVASNTSVSAPNKSSNSDLHPEAVTNTVTRYVVTEEVIDGVIHSRSTPVTETITDNRSNLDREREQDRINITNRISYYRSEVKALQDMRRSANKRYYNDQLERYISRLKEAAYNNIADVKLFRGKVSPEGLKMLSDLGYEIIQMKWPPYERVAD